MNVVFHEDYFDAQIDENVDIINVEVWNQNQYKQEDQLVGHGSFTIYQFQRNNGVVEIDLHHERLNAGRLVLEGLLNQRQR